MKLVSQLKLMFGLGIIYMILLALPMISQIIKFNDYFLTIPLAVMAIYQIINRILGKIIKNDSSEQYNKSLISIFISGFLILLVSIYSGVVLAFPLFFIFYYQVITLKLLLQKEDKLMFVKDLLINNEMPQEKKHSHLWLYGGFLLVIITLTLLEIREPMFFTRDDNYAQFLPTILEGCRSLFNDHVFSTLNPYQFMGSPTSNTGVYALTYPFTYLSYAAAKYVFNNEYLTLEIFCIFHLIIAYFTAFWAGHKSKLNPMLAMAFSLCYCLSGASLILGRCWYYVTPTIAMLPLFAISLIHLKNNKPDYKWIIASGILIGTLFHAGNVQLWVYSMLFYILGAGIMLWTKQINFKKALWLIPTFLFGLAICAPLLITQGLLTSQITRLKVINWGGGMLKSLGNLFFIKTYGFPQLFYSGGLATTLAFCAMILFFMYEICQKSYEDFKKFVKNNIWLVLGFIALILMYGPKLGLWSLLHSLPVLNGFRVPIKFIIFVNFFFNLGGFLLLQKLISRLKIPELVQTITTFVILWLISLNLIMPMPALFNFYDPIYPKESSFIPEIMRDKQDSRIIPMTKGRIFTGEYIQTFMLNFPSIYGVMSTEGYDDSYESTLKENIKAYKNIEKYNIEALKSYGVKYAVYFSQANDKYNNDTFLNIKSKKDFVKNIAVNSKFFAYNRKTEYYLIENPDKMAFVNDETKTQLPIKFNGQGAIVDISNLKQSEEVIINMLWRPEIVIFADKKAIKCAPDKWGRILINAPANATELTAKYLPNWNLGFLVGFIFAILNFLSTFILKKYADKKS